MDIFSTNSNQEDVECVHCDVFCWDKCQRIVLFLEIGPFFQMHCLSTIVMHVNTHTWFEGVGSEPKCHTIAHISPHLSLYSELEFHKPIVCL